jgi:predicted nucleic acid-binding protein
MESKKIVYVDSSALIKVFVEEQGSLEIEQYMAEVVARGNACFVTAAVTKAEVMAGLSAIRRGRHITQREFEEAVANFREQWNVFSIADVTTALIDRAGEIGLNYKIKGCDAFQLASALEGEADLLISTDIDLNMAADAHGLTVWNPMTEPQPK